MRIYELKWTHVQAQELLSCICQEISAHGEQSQLQSVKQAVFLAVRHGIVEFVIEIMKHYPDAAWWYNDYNQHIFLYATSQRQEKVFSLLYTLGAKKNSLAADWDKSYNNILHHAAYLAPPTRLDRVAGAALQMQRELQWFKVLNFIHSINSDLR